MSAAHRPKNSVMSSSVSAWVIPATGVRPPFLTFVAVRAIAPVAGMPPKSGVTMFATPCATSSMLERWRPPIIPSATTAESSDSTAPSSAIVNAGPTSRRACSSVTFGSAGRGSDALMRAEARADGLHRQLEEPRRGRRGDQRHERSRDLAS